MPTSVTPILGQDCTGSARPSATSKDRPLRLGSRSEPARPRIPARGEAGTEPEKPGCRSGGSRRSPVVSLILPEAATQAYFGHCPGAQGCSCTTSNRTQA